MSFRSSFVATLLGASVFLSPLAASAAPAPAGWVAAWATALQPIPDLAAPPPPVVYQPGYVVTSLPSGYRTVRYHRNVYYVNRNVYYRPHPHGYVVVAPPY